MSAGEDKAAPRPPLLVLAGPTAVGKTALAVGLAKRLGAEIVNADSVQVYRGLDVGSAKPTPEERAEARHHLVDVADPEEDFDAARFADLADRAIAGIHSRGLRIIVSGGTGLYLRALLQGLAPAPPVVPALRARLAGEWEELGPLVMHRRLRAVDPASAGRLHPNDRQRVLRALEVGFSSPRPLSELQGGHGFRRVRYPHLAVGLVLPREELNRRIEQRARAMFREGLLQETRALLDRGVNPYAKSLQTLGYRQAVAHLTGRLGLEEAVEATIRDTRAYAKRQMTWFRGMEGINWHHPGDLTGVYNRCRPLWGLPEEE